MSASELARFGTSIWLDDLSRSKLTGSDSHSLPHRIARDSVVGVTTNPSIFASAISGSIDYSEQIATMSGATAEEIITQLTADDVRQACDLFTEIYQSTNGVDGRVSIEVDPRSAHDTQATIAEALALHALIGRENVLIKVPATLAGLPAITAIVAAGISVNVTLIFSIDRYAAVIDAYLAGLQERLAKGEDISKIHSVASFFISRLDTAIDPLLKAAGRSDLCGKAAVANAHAAYELFTEKFDSDQWLAIAKQGGNMQRPLWASTGVKDPAMEDTRYVVELVAEHCVNTMPQATLDALIDHGNVRGDSITSNIEKSHLILGEIAEAGISMKEITDVLEADGVKKFADAWIALIESVEGAR